MGQLLSILVVFLPLVGILGLPFVRRERALAWSIGAALAVFAASLPMWFLFDTSRAGAQFEVDLLWLDHILNTQARLHLGVDGISILLVLLTTLITPLVLLSAPGHIKERQREFCFWMLLMECGMVGTFMALDLFLFYIFWEMMLVPLYFVIGIWGGKRRLYAAIKFFLFTLAGSLLMLAAILYLVLQSAQIEGGELVKPATAQILELAARDPLGWTPQVLCFLAFGLAFAIKVPLFPFHTWLPDAHVEAPTSGSVILAGVLLKMGTYGFLRFCLPLFPHATIAFAPWLLALALVGIIYGALLAWAQEDMKKLVAYSSISHLGFVVLGLFALDRVAMTGGLLQMVNHGLSTGALFLLVGVVYERRHTRRIEDFGGLARSMPRFAFFLMVATLASIGLPLTGGFVGEFMILAGTFKVSWLAAVLGATGVVLGAVYMLSMVRRVLFGPLDKDENRGLKDMSLRESLVLTPLVLLIFWIGVYPLPFLDRTRKSIEQVQERVAQAVTEVSK